METSFLRYYDPRGIVNVRARVQGSIGPIKAFMLTGLNKQTITLSKEQLTHAIVLFPKA